MGVRLSDSQTALLLLKLWQNKHNTNEIDYVAASTWADQQNLYHKPPISRQKRCEDEMRRAVKRATHTDPQGRKNVRTYGSLPLFDDDGNKTYIQIDMRTAEPSDAKQVLDDDYSGMKNDVRSHNIQRESYNDNNLFGATIEPYDYDFNGIVESMNMDGRYDDSFDENDFNDIDES
jgi:hypothetical protein